MMTDSDYAWATVRQAPYEMVDTYVSGLLMLQLIWRDRAWIRPSLVRQVAALRPQGRSA